MSTKEILTFQFGHYSNYIGAHWWNTQEAGFQYSPNETTPTEINHDVLYREGQTSNGQTTFTPRLLLVDLKDSLKTLPKTSDLYNEICEPNTSAVSWNENAIEVKYEEKPQKNELQEALSHEKPQLHNIKSRNLEKGIEVWSDYLYTRFHPRTVNIINDFSHNSEENPFDVFNLGKDIWKINFEEELTDKIRNYMEECDNLQGFQILLDATNAFGGLSSSCLEHIKDEYDKKTVLSIPVIPSYYSDYDIKNAEDRGKSTTKDSIRLINLLLTLDAMTENSCLTIPLCTGTKGWRQPGTKRNFQYLNYNPQSYYHTSAILSSAIDTITMPFRLKSTNFTINDFCSYLNLHGRKISAASLGMPFGIKSEDYLIDFLDKYEGSLWKSLTPNCEIENDKSVHLVTLRGIPIERLKKEAHLAEKQRDMPAYRCDSVQSMIEYYMQCTCIYSASRVTALNAPMFVKMPYPDIFNEYVDLKGNIRNNPRHENESVNSIPVIAGCHSGTGIGNMLEVLHRESGRIKIAKLHQFKTSGLEDDEYNECFNRILDLKDSYEESFD